MEDWKSRIYETYVSVSHRVIDSDRPINLALNNYPFYRVLIHKHVPKRRDIRIADLACGHGALLFCLKELGYRNIKGIDISEEQVLLAHRFGITEVEQDDINAFLAKQAHDFELIFMIDILEHLARQELFRTLDNVYNSLDSEGILIVHVPNAEGFFGMKTRYGDITHELCFTPSSMAQTLEAVGFREYQIFEDVSMIYGFKRFVRAILWHLLAFYPRLLHFLETGERKSVLSRSMVVVAKK
ncbi:MAG: class I SAM-dependent methyltransferase [bacterium]|nr:class I SAM-dependent methyltransferase [bacterium]